MRESRKGRLSDGEKIVAVLGVGAANVGVERVARPVGAHGQFRRHHEKRRAAAARQARGIVVVAGRKLDRRAQQERAGANAERFVRIALGHRQPPRRGPGVPIGKVFGGGAPGGGELAEPSESDGGVSGGGTGKAAPGRVAAISG